MSKPFARQSISFIHLALVLATLGMAAGGCGSKEEPETKPPSAEFFHSEKGAAAAAARSGDTKGPATKP